VVPRQLLGSTELDGRGSRFRVPLREMHGARDVRAPVAVEAAASARVVGAARDVDLLAGLAEYSRSTCFTSRAVRSGFALTDECADPCDAGAGGGGEAKAGGVIGFAIQ
jgi:hypothetical protein